MLVNYILNIFSFCCHFFKYFSCVFCRLFCVRVCILSAYCAK